MFLDATSNGCQTVVFMLGGNSDSRKWDIKVSQHECGSESGGPPGCLQYYTGTSGKIASFNYPTTSTSVSSTGAYFKVFLSISKIIVLFHNFQQLTCQTNYMTFVSEEHQVIWNLTFLESNTNV